jgi:hypothetical protein
MGIASLHLSRDSPEIAKLYQPSLRAKRSNPCRQTKESMDCFVAIAPLRKRFAFVAGNDGRRQQVASMSAAICGDEPQPRMSLRSPGLRLLEQRMRCKPCSEQRGYPYKRGQRLRCSKLTTKDDSEPGIPQPAGSQLTRQPGDDGSDCSNM